eukprot:gene666-8167_t
MFKIVVLLLVVLCCFVSVNALPKKLVDVREVQKPKYVKPNKSNCYKCQSFSGSTKTLCMKRCMRPRTVLKKVLKYDKIVKKDHVWGKKGKEFRCAVVCRARNGNQLRIIVKTPLKLVNKHFVGPLEDTVEAVCPNERSIECRCTKVINMMQNELEINLASLRRLVGKACPRGRTATVLELQNNLQSIFNDLE